MTAHLLGMTRADRIACSLSLHLVYQLRMRGPISLASQIRTALVWSWQQPSIEFAMTLDSMRLTRRQYQVRVIRVAPAMAQRLCSDEIALQHCELTRSEIIEARCWHYLARTKD